MSGRPRVLLLSPCGWGNLGDAAILDSAIEAVRVRRPHAVLVGVTLHPRDTRERHGIEAFALRGYSSDGYEIGPDDVRAPSSAETVERPPGALRRLARAVPFARTAWRAAQDARARRLHGRRAAPLLRAGDTLVVAGGGQLDDFWGGPSGHPQALADWTARARTAGARTVVLSVGTGRLGARSRALVARALASADYVSFRDEESRALADARPDAPVVPDLAYAVPLPPPPARTAAGPVIGVSPMVYRAPRAWPDADAAAYARHLDALAAVVARLAARGAAVRLFQTGGADTRAVADLLARLAPADRARVEAPVVDGVAALLTLFASLDAAVSARLHGVLLAHVAGRPCVALAHERKVRTLMREAGREADCRPIEGFDPVEAADRALALAAAPAEAEALAADAARRRARVEDQYDAVFGRSAP